MQLELLWGRQAPQEGGAGGGQPERRPDAPRADETAGGPGPPEPPRAPAPALRTYKRRRGGGGGGGRPAPPPAPEAREGEGAGEEAAAGASAGPAGAPGAREEREREPKPRGKAKGKGKLRQLFIDFGQGDFGHRVCPTCGMMYSVGVASDEATHRAFHERVEHGVRFPGGGTAGPDARGERTLWRGATGGPERIVRLGRAVGTPPAKARAVAEVARLVEERQGLAEGWILRGGPGGGGEGGGGDRRQHQLLYVAPSKHVQGCVFLEELPATRPIFRVVGGPGGGQAGEGEEVSSAPKAAQAREVATELAKKVGVRMVWVHPARRRRGVARRLLGLAVRELLTARGEAPDDLAFSAVTEDGLALARAFVGPGRAVHTYHG